MDFEETMAEEIDTQQEEDLLSEDVVEEPEDEGEDLESLDESAEDEPKEEPKGTTEPGYVQKRISKAVQKAVAETEARMQAMFEQQMAPIRAKMMEDEAQELVRSRKVGDIETARELVRLRQGQPAQVEDADDESDDEQERYVDVEVERTQGRIEELKRQAAKIKAKTGLDVIAEWNSNKEVQQAVMDGEMDFYDVAEQMKQQTKRRPPSPMRSPNGASGSNQNAIETMTKEQFARLEKRISEGARYRLK